MASFVDVHTDVNVKPNYASILNTTLQNFRKLVLLSGALSEAILVLN